MRMGGLVVLVMVAGLAGAARAQVPAAAASGLMAEPATLALIQMLQEAQQREAMALIRAITAERQLAQAQAQLRAQPQGAVPGDGGGR